MSSAAWDILKYFIPYLHIIFNSADASDYMKRSVEAYEQIRDAAPSDLRNFVDEHYRGLKAFRVETWRKLGDELKDSELGSALTDLEILILLEGIESRLFVPVRK